MFCQFCGSENSNDAIFCQKCGKKLSTTNSENDSYAIAGFVIGLLSFLFCWSIFVPILGIVLSSKGKKSSKSGLAKTGKILSIVSLIPGIIIITIFLTITGVSTFGHIVNSDKDNKVLTKIENEYIGKREVLSWYSSLGAINIDKENYNLEIEVVIGYEQNNQMINQKITNNNNEIILFLTDYFNEIDCSVYTVKDEDKIREDIKNGLNNGIFNEQIISDIRFLAFNIIKE